jgi:cytochrome c551/c552
MKKRLFIASLLVLAYACSDQPSEKKDSPSTASSENTAPVDDKKGVGKFTHVDLAASLDKKMAVAGSAIYDMKCSGCHKLTAEKLVGPGWKNVTSRRKPEWIMNFVSNTEEMLNKDTTAQAMLEICMVKMPNQNLSDEEARAILEFMRKNDGIQ